MATCSIRTISNLLIKSISNKSVVGKSLLRKRGNPSYTFASYRAAVLNKFGEPLVIEERKPQSKLNDTEVRIDVGACGINSSDQFICKGEHESKPELPFIPGYEICGEVTELGPAVKHLQVGDRVIGLNKDKYSGFAEECVISEKDLWVVPQSMEYQFGASLINTYGLALLGLQERAEISKDDVVMVLGAAGGLGLAAVDLAINAYEAKVLAVCDTEDNAAVVRDMGAWAALGFVAGETPNYRLSKTAMYYTDKKGVDILFDTVGGDALKEALAHCVAPGGRVITAASRDHQSITLTKGLKLFRVSLSNRTEDYDVYREMGDDVIELYDQRQISPHISATFALEQVNEALEFFRSRNSVGKVVLKIK